MRYWNSAPPRDATEAGEWAAYLEDMQRRLGYAQWRVSERAGDRLVGIAGLQPLDGGPEVELTYALEPSLWGRGLRDRGRQRRRSPTASRRPGSSAWSASPSRRTGVRGRPAQARDARRSALAEYWGTRWAKYAVAAAGWRAEQAAARPPLVTERLELRRFTAADLEPLLAVFGDAEVMRYVGAERRPLTADEVRGLLTARRRTGREHGFGPLAVVERASGGCVGEAGLQLLEAGPDIELTYTLARAAWGRGYATEAARAVLRWAFAGLRLPRIVAVADPENTASLRVLEKLGMRRRDGVSATAPRTWRSSRVTLGAWRDLAGPAPARG